MVPKKATLKNLKTIYQVKFCICAYQEKDYKNINNF